MAAGSLSYQPSNAEINFEDDDSLMTNGGWSWLGDCRNGISEEGNCILRLRFSQAVQDEWPCEPRIAQERQVERVVQQSGACRQIASLSVAVQILCMRRDKRAATTPEGDADARRPGRVQSSRTVAVESVR